MNTLMYNHPLTAHQLKTVIEVLGYTVEGPIGKNLACGDVGKPQIPSDQATVYLSACPGMGAMTEWTNIVKIVVERWKLMLTLGP